LKPLDAAIADGDRIRAVIRGSVVGHAGRNAAGLTAFCCGTSRRSAAGIRSRKPRQCASGLRGVARSGHQPG
jgi:hypothetical protein